MKHRVRLLAILRVRRDAQAADSARAF